MLTRMNWKQAGLLALGFSASFGVASPAQAITYELDATAFTKAMPDGTIVPMWGFALRGAAPTVPGPALVVPPDDTALTISLTNHLGVPISIVIPGQTTIMTPQPFLDAQGRQRVRSFTTETPPGATINYTFTGLKPGTYLYHSGTHPQVQVQMGLYGALFHDAAAGQAYPGVVYDSEAVVFYSEIDPALHESVAAGTYGTVSGPTSTINYAPRYFLVNGEPHSVSSQPIAAGNVNGRTLVRFLNAGLRTHVPVLNGQYLNLVAEDGRPYPHAKEQYSVNLPALKTVDALMTPSAAGSFALFDGRLDLTSDGWPDGGLLARLLVGGGGAGPAAVNDLYTVVEDATLTVTPDLGVLANDTGTAPLSALLVSDVANGTLALAADGSFSYTPGANYSGPDSFTYRVSDGTTFGNTATASLTITPANDPPVASADAYRIVAGGTLSIGAAGVLANDTDPDGDALTALPVSGPTGGTLTLNADGSFSYAAPSVAGTYTFDYQASDGAATSNTVTVTITAAANSAPVAVDDNGSTVKNVAVVIAVLGNDRDPDAPVNTIDPATVQVGKAVTQRGGTVVANADGTIAYTPKRNFRGTDSFTYTVRDTVGAVSNVATVRVNVK